MKFKKLLTEIKAEIQGNKFPDHLVFDDNDNIIGDKLKGGAWEKVFNEILIAIKKQGLSKLFSANKDPVDVFGATATGKINMQDDNGKKYYFDTATKKIYNRK